MNVAKTVYFDRWIANQCFFPDCRFDCDNIGTINGVCDKISGFCQCHDGFHGELCDQGKSRTISIVIF